MYPSRVSNTLKSPVTNRLEQYKRQFYTKQAVGLEEKKTTNAEKSNRMAEEEALHTKEQNAFLLRMEETLRSRDETIEQYNLLVGNAKILSKTIEKRNTSITALQTKIKELSRDKDDNLEIIKFLEAHIEELRITEQEKEAAAYSNQIRYLQNKTQQYQEGTQAHKDHQGLKMEEFTMASDILQTPVPVKTPAERNLSERQRIAFVGKETAYANLVEIRTVLGNNFLENISYDPAQNKYYNSENGEQTEISEEEVLALLDT